MGNVNYYRDVEFVTSAVQKLTRGAPVRWATRDSHLSPGVWRATWVDVHSSNVGLLPGLGWTWRVVAPEDLYAPAVGEASVYVPVKPDCVVYTVMDEDTQYYSKRGPVFTVGRGKRLSLDARRKISKRGEVVSAEAWTADAISLALSEWCSRVAGRAGTQFSFDPYLRAHPRRAWM